MPWRDALFHRGEEWLKSMDLEQFLRFRTGFLGSERCQQREKMPPVIFKSPDFEDWIAVEGLGSTRP